MGATVLRDAVSGSVDVRPIAPLIDRILDELTPFEIRLFGSRARGTAEPISDWDLFVVVPDDLPVADDPYAGYRLRRETKIRADVILCPRSEFEEDRDTPNTLAYEAAHFGALIYER